MTPLHRDGVGRGPRDATSTIAGLIWIDRWLEASRLAATNDLVELAPYHIREVEYFALHALPLLMLSVESSSLLRKLYGGPSSWQRQAAQAA